MPASAEAALSGNTLLGTLTCGSTLGNVSNGVLTFNTITEDSAADATGTITFVRIATSGGVTIADADVTANGGGGTIQINSTAIVTGGPIQITTFSITEA